MVKIKHREISPEMLRMVKPDSDTGRFSTGLENRVGEYYFLPVDKIKPYKNQARKVFQEEEIQQLADTIKEFGIRQPLSVIPSDDGESYEVISGERRLRAAKSIFMETVPCLIIKTKEVAEEISLIENIQRSDLHPIELGDAYAKILENKGHGGITHLAKKLGKPKSSISEGIKFSKIHNDVKEHIITKNIRSKKILRKVASLESLEEIKKFLKMIPSEDKYLYKNILRVNFENGKFQFETEKINKLSKDEINNLKCDLILFANKL